MALRDWRPRRIIGRSLGWAAIVFGVSVARAAMWERSVGPTADEVYVAVRLVGGLWLLLGPPVLVALVWWFSRRGSRPAS